jgi:hypothetical protein
MKKFIITEEEKSRILNMHKSISAIHYLMEQGCQNQTPNFVFPAYVPSEGWPDGVDVAEDPYGMSLPTGTYNLVKVKSDPNKVDGVGNPINLLMYYVNDSSGCFTGYIISFGEIFKTNRQIESQIPKQINITSGDNFTVNGEYTKVFEISNNRYPKTNTDGGQTIR